MNSPNPHQPQPGQPSGQPIPPHLVQGQQPNPQGTPQPVQPVPQAGQPVYTQTQPVYPQAAQPVQPQPVQPQYAQPQPVQPQPYSPQPQYAQPQPVQPQAPQPQYAQPQPVQPQPYSPQPQYAQPQPVQPQAPQPQYAQPQPVQPQAPQPQYAQPQPVQPQAPQPQSSASTATSGLRPQPVANRPVPADGRPISDRKPIVRGEPEGQEEEEEEDESEVAAEMLKGSPPWLVSLFVHMGLLVVLALLVLTTQSKPPIEMEVIYAETEGEQLEDDSLDMFSPDPMDLEEPIFSKDVLEVSDPLAAPPDIPTVTDAQFNTSTMEAPSIGLALSGREKGAKSALLAAYGGTALTEAAVTNALKWLKKQQRSDGSWSLMGPYSDGAVGENKPAATAMALLAFQGAGSTHLRGQFKAEVAKGIEALLRMMDEDGTFFIKEGVRRNHKLYTQAQCTIALAELYGMTKDPKLKAKAQLALDYAARSQSAEGGWRYEPRSDADTSVTGWFVMALQSGMMASELTVKDETLNNITKYLDAAQSSSGSRYAYQPGEGPTLAMTAEGLLCRQYLGWPKNNSSLRRGVDYLLQNKMNSSQRDVYYWYYATQVLHHMGGDDWDQWNDVMRELLPSTQVDAGPEAGSWSPGRDAWGGHGGRLYTTCLSTYMLEVYYRHLPIYKHF